MHKTLISVLAVFMLPGLCLAKDYGDVNYHIDMLNSGDTVNELNTSGNIAILEDGSVNLMKDSTFISSMFNGTVTSMTDTSKIDTMHGGTVNAMNGSSYIVNMNNGTVNAMNETSYIDAMHGGTVGAMDETSYINKLAGGRVGDIAAGAKINSITGGTLFGNVANGEALNLDSGRLTLNGDLGKTFDRAIVGSTGSQVTIQHYSLGSNASVTLGEDSLLTLGNVSLPHARFNGGGVVRVDSFDNGVPYANADISTFSAGNSVLFDFDVDFEEGGDGNDTLTIYGVGADNTASQHLIAVTPRSEAVTTARDKIDLLQDSTGSLSFSLLDGIVGVGAFNYSLDSEVIGSAGKQWFLGLYTGKLLSNAANIIGSMPTANLTSVYSLQNALHKRMGDLRNYSEKGVWFRTYTNQTEFNDLIKTKVRNYGTEVGFDKQIAEFDDSSLSLGVAGGVNYADVEMKHSRFKDGGETTMPYVGLYGTWVTDNGFYVDAIGRYIRNDTKAHFHDSLGVKRDFDVKGNIGALSVETGKQYYITDRFILQPRAELSYIYMQVDSFKDALGYQAKYEDTQSLLGAAGLIARYDMGKFSPYAKASFLYEFDGKTNIIYDNFAYDSSIRGARAEGALGLVWNMTDNWHFFAEAGYQGGAKHYKNYNGNLGLRYSFGKSQEKAAAAAPVSVMAAPTPVLPETAPKRKPQNYDSIAVFEFNSSRVNAQARQKIQQAAEEIKQTDYQKVTVIGHTDTIGTHPQNEVVSLRRANAVAAEFEKAGIEKTALEAYGEAYDVPIADNSTAAGRAKNRRVDVKVE